MIRYEIVCFSFGTTFGGQIQKLQCTKAQANLLCIQCFSLEFCLQCPALADFEDWQLGLQEHTVSHLKDLVHICWEPEAQGCVRVRHPSSSSMDVIHGWHPRMTLPSMDDISPSMDDIHGWHFSIHGWHFSIHGWHFSIHGWHLSIHGWHPRMTFLPQWMASIHPWMTFLHPWMTSTDDISPAPNTYAMLLSTISFSELLQ